MAAITWRRGETKTLTFTPLGAALTGATARIEVQVPGAPVQLPLTLTAEGFVWSISNSAIPASLLTRTYKASIVISWPDSSVDRDDFLFSITDPAQFQTDRFDAMQVDGAGGSQTWPRPKSHSPPALLTAPSIGFDGNDWAVTAGTWARADSVDTAITLGAAAVAATGTLSAVDNGKLLKVVETATNASGTATAEASAMAAYIAVLLARQTLAQAYGVTLA